jgi:hypothetical protein
MDGLLDRMRRAVMLDASLYEEVEHDQSLNREALTIVIIVSVAGGISAFLGGIIGGQIGRAFLGALLGVVMGVANYYIWAYVTQWVGTSLFDGTADVGEMLRVLGYAHTPRLLGLLSFITCVGPIVALVGSILSLIAAIIGIREALDFDTGKAILTAIIGWVVILIISTVVGLIVGIPAIGFAAAIRSIGN